MSIHRLNQLLPPAEISTLQKDDINNVNEIFACLEQLAKSGTNQVEVNDILDSAVATKLFKLLQFRRSLKFQSNEAFYERVLKSIYHAYIYKRMTVSMKSVMLQMMNEICSIRKFKSTLEFPDYDWRVFWDQSMSIVTRAKKTESISSGEALVDYLSKLCTFCYSSRRFVSETEASKILVESMTKLIDTRQHTCVEGLIMLVNCLPNKHTDYDTILPQWLVLWKSINFSPTWDVCWLTLFNRARYHTTTFDWSSLTGWLMIKTKELLILPHNEPIHSDKMYRMEFQKYYTNMLPFGNQHRKLALSKVAKLLYFVTVIHPSLPIPVNIDTSGNSAKPPMSLVVTLPITITPPTLSEDCLFSVSNSTYPGYNNTSSPVEIAASANELSIFFQSLRYFLYASNSGNWTQNLAIFTMHMIGEMTRHVGVSFIQNVYSFSDDIKEAMKKKRLLHLLSVTSSASTDEGSRSSIHIPTIKYLCGLLTMVSLEGLFGKDQGSSYVYASCLKSIICIDPQVGHIIMPFMLSALTVVNQSHQAPIAIHALTVCFRHLLYPVPVALSYLPELLQSLLPGLDTADRTKTFVTLHLIATILAWVPIQDSYTSGSNSGSARSYLALIELATTTDVAANDSATSVASSLTQLVKQAVSLQGQLDALAAAFQDWIPQFLDKYFLLLEAREGKQAGTGSGGSHNHATRDHKGDGSLCEAIGYLFQAISATTQPVLRQVVESRVLDYFKKTTPINAAKIAGKVLEYMTVTSRGTNLKLIFDTFLDKDTLTVGNISPDKVAFRLRLICGAVRECNGSALVPLLTQLLPYTESPFTQHSEKPVRKAAHKLVKDILKGMTSIYPLTVSPTSTDTTAASSPQSVLGAPVPLQSVEWHIPSTETLTVAVQFLRQKTTTVMNEVKTLLDIMTSASSSVNVTNTKKASDDLSKTEDSIVFNLKILTKLLRGAAEVLGDEFADGATSAGGVLHVMGVDIDISSSGNGETMEEEDDDGRALTAARAITIATLSSGDQVFLKQLRSAVLEFLIYIHQCLDTFSVTPAVVFAALAATSATKSYASLSNSATVRKAWLKLLIVVITRRHAWLRNASDARKSLTINKELGYGQVAKKIKHDLSSLCGAQSYASLQKSSASLNGVSLSPQLLANASALPGGSGGGLSTEMMSNLCNMDYWKYHDACTNNAVNRVWVMYAIRQVGYAISSNKQQSLQREGGNGRSRIQLLTAFLCVAQMSSHEYDLVRQEAIVTLSKLVSYYSVPYFLHHILMPLTRTLAVPGTTYSQAVGVLALLKSPSIMAKICNQWELSDTLLQVILRTPSMVASPVVETDKKERIMAMIGDVMVQYAKGFNHVPFLSSSLQSSSAALDGADRAQGLLAMALNTLSIDNVTGLSVQPAATITGGLRYESYAGYIVLHLIGHNDIQLTRGMWVWALRTVMNVRGQPTVFIAWSALVKLAYITFIKANSSNNSNVAGGEFATLVYDILFKDSLSSSTLEAGAAVSSSDSVALTAVSEASVTTALTTTINTKNSWVDFLQGLSSCGSGGSGGAQWSRGLLEIIHSAEYLRGTFPRKLFPSKQEPSYSSHVVKENVGLFMSLFSYLHKHSSNDKSILSKSVVSRFLEDSKTLKTASEDDARQNNAMRASLWSGLYRTMLSSTFNSEDEKLGLEAVLTQFFIEQVDKISTDFCSDWAEAVMLALVVVFPKDSIAGTPCKLKLVEYLMEGFETALNDQTISTATAVTSATASTNEDGFARIDNRLLLAESLLQAELSTDYHLRVNGGSSGEASATNALIGHRMLSFLQQPHINLISPYRSTREHLATIVGILSQLDYAACTPLDTLWIKLSSDASVAEELSTVATDTTTANMDVVDIDTAVNGLLPLSKVDISKSSSSNGSSQHHQTRAQHILQFACHCLRYFAYESAANIEWVMPDILALMSLTLKGSGCSDIETAKTCHQTCIFVSITLKSFAPFASTTITFVSIPSVSTSSSLTPLVDLLKSHANHASFHVRETVLLCCSIVMTNNWFTLTLADKKTLKDILAEGLVDIKPEVQVIAMGGMVSYLTAKPANEIATIANAYTKNSDILAAREKKKRKMEKGVATTAVGTNTGSEKPDKVYVSTVMMVACLVLTFPYDMPPFLPALVASFVKHKNTSVVQNTVMKVIQMFKRTHQDRWESDYKKAFTHEQLEDVQGAGAAHYFS